MWRDALWALGFKVQLFFFGRHKLPKPQTPNPKLVFPEPFRFSVSGFGAAFLEDLWTRLVRLGMSRTRPSTL